MTPQSQVYTYFTNYLHTLTRTICTVWSTSPSPITVESFTGTSGPAVSISSDPMELFSLYFGDSIIDAIVRETNRYAFQCRGNEEWQTNPAEIRAYLGFNVLMGINHLPEIRDYWSRDPRLHYAPISDRISRDRYEEISRYLHFVDNETLPQRGESGYERLQKVKPIISAIRERCLKTYRPKKENSIDEAMIPFKGE